MSEEVNLHEIIDNKLYTLRQVAELVNFDETTVRRWAKNNLIEVVVMPSNGKRLLYRIYGKEIKKVLTRTNLDMIHKG